MKPSDGGRVQSSSTPEMGPSNAATGNESESSLTSIDAEVENANVTPSMPAISAEADAHESPEGKASRKKRSKHARGEDGSQHPVARDFSPVPSDRMRDDASVISGPRQFSAAFGDSGSEDEWVDEGTAVDTVRKKALESMTPEQRDKVLKRAKRVAKKSTKSKKSTKPERSDKKVRIADKTKMLERAGGNEDERASQSSENDAGSGPSYFDKGKMRADDVEGTDVAQVAAD
jgi:hypothetical protein